MSKSPKPYLNYFDKEMTIMGLLSAFSIGLAAFATERICSATSGILAEVWKTGGMHACAGVVAAVVAGFFFYLQRSFTFRIITVECRCPILAVILIHLVRQAKTILTEGYTFLLSAITLAWDLRIKLPHEQLDAGRERFAPGT